MKKKIIGLFILLIILFPKSTYALTGSLTITCDPSSAKAGEKVTCTLNGSSDEAVYSIEIPFSITNATVEFKKSDLWAMEDDYSNNKIQQVAKTDKAVIGNFNIGTFTVTINENATSDAVLSISNAFFDDTDYQHNNVENTSVTIGVEIPKGLKNLEVTGATLAPQFTSSNTAYTVTLGKDATKFSINSSATVDTDSITITNTDTGAQLSSTDIPFATEEGKDSMSITISVGSGDRKVDYTLLVRKEAEPNTVGHATLSSLVVGDKTVTNFSDEITVNPSNIDSYQVRATLSDSTNYKFSNSGLPSSCSVSAGVLTCNLKGENSFPIAISSNAAGGESKTYILTIKKASSGNGGNSGNNSGSSTTPDTGRTVNNNPQTGNTTMGIVAIVLVASLFASLYLYKRNMQNFE